MKEYLYFKLSVKSLYGEIKLRTPEIFSQLKNLWWRVDVVLEVAKIAMSPRNFVLQFVSFSLHPGAQKCYFSKGWWPLAILFDYFFTIQSCLLIIFAEDISISSQLPANAQWAEPSLRAEIRNRACYPASKHTTI